MDDAPALKLAVMSDLHVGGPAGGGFQNPFLTTDAGTLIGPAVEAINSFAPDLVIIPGDLTHNATQEQLDGVLDCLNGLDAPFMVCRGNHDCETPEAAGRFDRALGRHHRPGVTAGAELGLPDSVATLVLESAWKEDGRPYEPDDPPLARVDGGLMESALADLERTRPDLLLVVSHYPLVSQADYVHAVGGHYAGHVQGGEAFLGQLTDCAGSVIIFCGHNHHHHVMCGKRWLQCATGAMAEYPAEFRLVTIEREEVTIATTTTAQGILDAAPEPENSWVRGRPQDREVTWRAE